MRIVSTGETGDKRHVEGAAATTDAVLRTVHTRRARHGKYGYVYNK
jgi:hypothetical protein